MQSLFLLHLTGPFSSSFFGKLLLFLLQVSSYNFNEEHIAMLLAGTTMPFAAL